MMVLRMLAMTRQTNLKTKNKIPQNIRRRRIVGLVRHIGNVVYGQPYQGFESLRLRHKNQTPRRVFYFCVKVGRRDAPERSAWRIREYTIRKIIKTEFFNTSFYRFLLLRIEDRNSSPP